MFPLQPSAFPRAFLAVLGTFIQIWARVGHLRGIATAPREDGCVGKGWRDEASLSVHPKPPSLASDA